MRVRRYVHDIVCTSESECITREHLYVGGVQRFELIHIYLCQVPSFHNLPALLIPFVLIKIRYLSSGTTWSTNTRPPV